MKEKPGAKDSQFRREGNSESRGGRWGTVPQGRVTIGRNVKCEKPFEGGGEKGPFRGEVGSGGGSGPWTQ